ncbi:LpqB family beta-propeller domain-containing protein [Nocardioides piscis]|uniref:GerMN domain-containing protein n=1 Tax=Nocardioides piscis TaxID=2714938 RepID=A0A6G7YFL7_9ACTN|nr:LpqB family beta-propeller domain-containing protein [Nocardioides piscis]QIK75612.1 hypothetical protein G7071_09305 [Nocardioides piscis]
MRTRLAHAVIAICVVILASACVRMPSEGPVSEVDSESRSDNTPGTYFDPKPPQPGESQTEIVLNFLEAMRATPIQMGVAREFLSVEAQKAWEPEESILTYAELGDPVGTFEVVLPMEEIEQYDARGAWQRSRSTQELSFGLTSEEGEWRIDRLPDGMVVPASWFESQFRRVSLYYFDPTGQILVPEPVFVPEGDQLASSLVDGLVNDPSIDPRISRTFFPPELLRGLSVPITEDGIAEVSLAGPTIKVDAEITQRILTQLVWTMRQEPRIRAVSLTVGEEELVAPGDTTQIGLDVGSAFDPTGAEASSDLFGLVDGLLVRGSSIGALQPTAGPLGTQRLGARSIGVNLSGVRVAAVSGDGGSVLVAPVDEEGRAVQVVSAARDLLPPAWDFADRLWLVERGAGRARVSVVAGDRPPREIEVQGVTGRDVRHVLVSRDGSRLVAVVRRPDGDRVLVSRILHDEAGGVLRTTRAVPLAFAPQAPSLVIRDITWRSPSAISVLSDLSRDLSLVETISVDGAPGDPGIGGATRVQGGTRELVGSPVEGIEIFALSGDDVSDVTAPELPVASLPKDLVSLTYVG